MSYIDKFRVEPGSSVHLDEIDPGFTGKHEDEAGALERIAKGLTKLGRLQYLLYADCGKSLLVILQALDAGGKDGTVRHVFGAMNPQGTYAHSFKEPSAEEAAHDFLWRAHRVTPARGEVAIFNRSYYEDVLVVRVHDLVPKEVWSKRYDLINDFENNLTDNGTHILKFYLHISYDEQLKRFWQRLNDPDRQWKISESDYKECQCWDDYMKAYETALERCSTKHAPWFIIPANHKWFRDLAVTKIITETLESLGLKAPVPTVNIDDIRRKYHAAELLDSKGSI
jgi:PPK2 family polyphosphate:nucleotide phosphotransferase